MSLKELTKDNHRNAERKEFASILMSGSIDPFLYYKYLANQKLIYTALEIRLPLFGMGIQDIARSHLIDEDMKELEELHGFHFVDGLIMPSTVEYMTHCEKKVSLRSLAKDETLEDTFALIPHMYVRHFGDMYGGAMIAKRVPGSGMMYKFDEKDLLKSKVRAILNDDMADEANICFEYAIRLFGELV